MESASKLPRRRARRVRKEVNMDKNNWSEAGEEIRRLVQDAVEQQDFSQLSSTIADVVNQTVYGFQNVLKESVNGKGQRQDGRTYHEAADRIRREMDEKNREKRQESSQKKNDGKMKPPGKILGTVMAWTGYSFSAVFGLALAILMIVGFSAGVNLSLLYGILGLLFGGSFWLGYEGSRRLGLANRFRRYRGLLAGRTFCAIEELASGTGKSIGYIRKDLKQMIRKGFFLEGHLDRQETCLITDHETYRQYLLTQQEYDRKAEKKLFGKKKEEPEQEQDAGKAAEGGEELSRECRALLEEGKRYIEHIRRCNDLIPGEDFSAKLDRLELVVTRIFREVERRPELAPELRKMMNYYLPTTQKLLDAYCNLDAQAIRGQNIDKTKQEIEDALDTINTAFENLLDSFFENTAWDISSDISVLHTMFAQEGLTGKDFGGSN